MSRARSILALVAVAVVAGLADAARAQDRPPPLRSTVAPDTTYGCIMCHAEKRRSFVQGIHSEAGIRCDDCHGGDVSAVESEPAHAGEFLGSPSKNEVVRLCASCHSDVERMRPFGLPADQVAEFRTSRHGQLLLEEGNTDVPTCSGCHDAHTILPPDDARSSVHPTQIPRTCAACHSDEERMAPYGIGTGQFEDFRQSAHGVALFEEENFAAPSCVGCHGSHSALPPRVMEIANVCGRCHVRVERAFETGPHGAAAAAGAIAGCTACHDNHETEIVPPERVGETCTRCHEAESPAARAGAEIEERMVEAVRELEAAEEALADMERAGRDVDTQRFRFLTARTAFHQFQQVQHSLDMEQMEDLSLRIRSVTGDIRGAAESVEERRWEHKLLLVPIWFLALAGIVLAWFRRHELQARSDEEWDEAWGVDDEVEPDEEEPEG